MAHKDTPITANMRLTKETKRLREEVSRQNNLWRRFLLGIVFGLGSAIGAGAVASIVIYFLRGLIGGIPSVV